MTRTRDLDALIDLLHQCAALDDGEVVDLLAHGLQCAAILKAQAPDDIELQIAGLVHDIGHVLAPGADAAHPKAGARAVAPILGDRVAFLVRHHVEAKRYLVSRDPAYAARLSFRSVESLAAQGGPLPAERAAALERSADLEAVLMLRRADDAAKVPGADVPDLASWLPRLRQAYRPT